MATSDSNFSRFINILEEIQIRAAKLEGIYGNIFQYSLHTFHALHFPERIRLVGWMKKLRECQGANYPDPNLRETYARCILHYLEHEGNLKAPPFDKAPLPGALEPFPEILAKQLRDSRMLFTETGPLQPIMEHTSPDGRATVSAKRTDDGSLLCYLSVSRK